MNFKNMEATEVSQLLIKQLNNLYFINDSEGQSILSVTERVFSRLEYCFNNISNKYYCSHEGAVFDGLHTCQYTMFLYETAHTLYKENSSNRSLCDRIYGISKIISSADLFYEIDLPHIYFCEHPQGSVLGRAAYNNYFVFMQGCTVGNNKGRYPKFGEHVYMMSGSKVLGNCMIGDKVVISANTYIKDQDIPSGTIVFGSSPDLTIKSLSDNKLRKISINYFNG